MTDAKDTKDTKDTKDAKDSSEAQGYGKPPKSGQFAKGRSGNPRGRPKKEPSDVKRRPGGYAETDIERVSRESPGHSQTLGSMSSFELLHLAQYSRALSGDKKAIKALVRSRLKWMKAEIKRLGLKPVARVQKSELHGHHVWAHAQLPNDEYNIVAPRMQAKLLAESRE